MPMGIVTNVAAALAGGLLGLLLLGHISDAWKTMLNNTLGLAAMVLGLTLLPRVNTLSVVVLSLIAGAILGEALGIEDAVNRLATAVTKKLVGGDRVEAGYLMQVSAVMVLFCCSGTGWYGALNEGLTGDGSILITKAILDGVTACVFAALLGRIVVLLCVPMAAVYAVLYSLSGLVAPYITPAMIGDFSAVGGIITLVAGLRLTRIKTDIKVLNLLPCLVLSFFVSAAWTALMG